MFYNLLAWGIWFCGSYLLSSVVSLEQGRAFLLIGIIIFLIDKFIFAVNCLNGKNIYEKYIIPLFNTILCAFDFFAILLVTSFIANKLEIDFFRCYQIITLGQNLVYRKKPKVDVITIITK